MIFYESIICDILFEQFIFLDKFIWYFFQVVPLI